MAQRFACRHCGKGFLAKPWDKNGQASTCKRAKCEKKSSIYASKKSVSSVQGQSVHGDVFERYPDRVDLGRMDGVAESPKFTHSHGTIMTPSEMGKKSASKLTPEERSKRAKKASLAARKKYGKNRMKKVRAGKTFKKD